ncbi:hypothetical protein ABIA35_005998 [Catenulispora sp. MAP12-49]|uniref:hypothetical protein n=1 Tax=Catenulispora sp. MAP12-49 TaxID=3156302 RepID=UPI003517641D
MTPEQPVTPAKAAWRKFLCPGLLVAAGVVGGGLIAHLSEQSHRWRPAFGDVATWALVVAATWAGWSAWAQLQKVDKRQEDLTELLRAAESAKSLKAVKLISGGLRRPGWTGWRAYLCVLSNGSGQPLSNVRIFCQAQGQFSWNAATLLGDEQAKAALLKAGESIVALEDIRPFAVSTAEGLPPATAKLPKPNWYAEFTDLTGQHWALEEDKAPARIPNRGWPAPARKS